MRIVVLYFLCLGFAFELGAQNKEIIAEWETKIGHTKLQAILGAVAKLDSSLAINTTPIFYDGGAPAAYKQLANENKLLFYVQERHTPSESKSVDVYSYTDVKMQDEQLRDLSIPRKYAVVFDFTSSQLIRLEKEGEKLVAAYSSYVSKIQINDEYVLLYDFGADIFTYEANGVIHESYTLAQYSWNKGLNCDVYLVSLKDGSRKLLGKDIEPAYRNFPFYKLSPDGRFVLSYRDHQYYSYAINTGVSRCITSNIPSGFVQSKRLDNYYSASNSLVGWKNGDLVLIKDAQSAIWELDLNGKKHAVKQVKQTEPPTSSNLAAERKEGTVVTEEISWKTFDGRMGKGVLAKPKDFDPNKKYPILFIYYELPVIRHNADRSYGMGDFVDYGYLVFSPNIEYTLGETGNSVFNYVVSAAEYFKKQPYVDAKRMGLRGASFGGYETNYLVTHSNLFAAAISIAGLSNFISNMGALNNGTRPHGLEGTDQNRLGVTMWQRPDIWIKNSPIFYADRVTAPVLLIHSESDDNVPFEQNLVFFRALRSMGKRSWLLQYDGVGHNNAVTTSIVGRNDGKCDMCTRQLQFFNHYLKGEPAPLWMLDGVPAREKGKKTGLELDTQGRTPGPGLRREKPMLTADQEELLKHKTTVTDDGRIIDVIKDERKLKNRKGN